MRKRTSANEGDNMKKYFFIFALFCSIYAQKHISIDFSETVDTMKSDLFGGIKGPGIASEYLRATGMKYIRTHDYHGPADYCYYSDFWNTDASGEFTTINEDFDPDNPADYDWIATDMKLNAIVDNGFEIYFRLGVSFPNTSLPPQIYDPPIDSYDDTLSFSRFASLCKHTAMHYNDGWDDGFYHDIEYFEIWCEPGGEFWDGSKVQFYYMFKFVSDTMKAYDPSIKIGGPGLIAGAVVGGNPNYREKFLAFMDSTDTQLDFYSWHIAGLQNPYSLKAYADTFRNMLNDFGFNNTESHIVLITSEEDTIRLAYSPKGAAHYTACAITIQRSSIDKIFWYPYNFMVIAPGEDTVYTQAANSMKAFHLMQEETPLIVSSDGDEVIPHPFDRDTTNFMTLAAKSQDSRKLFILIANSKSLNDEYSISINNLPWTDGDTILLMKNLIIDTLNFIEEDDTIYCGGDSLLLSFSDVDAPSVLFLRLINLSISNIYEERTENPEANLKILKNPFNNVCEIRALKNSDVRIFDVSGKLVFFSSRQDGKNSYDEELYRKIFWQPSAENSSGIYLVEAINKGRLERQKVLYIK